MPSLWAKIPPIIREKRVAEECGEEITGFLKDRGMYAQVTTFGHLVIDLSRSSTEQYEEFFPVL